MGVVCLFWRLLLDMSLTRVPPGRKTIRPWALPEVTEQSLPDLAIILFEHQMCGQHHDNRYAQFSMRVYVCDMVIDSRGGCTLDAWNTERCRDAMGGAACSEWDEHSASTLPNRPLLIRHREAGQVGTGRPNAENLLPPVANGPWSKNTARASMMGGSGSRGSPNEECSVKSYRMR
ncbi:hypothetical protein LZ31DRAFT_36361 [Colletotrichum somersetense]|nr:hypothetical protein LZ31DRAFT_36361 [Colletotrichum somersetense]